MESSAASSSRPSAPSAGLHILFLDPLFRQPDAPGDLRTHDMVRRLSAVGHHVTVLTTSSALTKPFQADLDISLRAIRAPNGERFGYGAPQGTYPRFAWGAAWRMWMIKNVDAVVAMDRPVASLPWAVLFCVVRGIPLVIDTRHGSPAAADRSAPIGQKLQAWLTRATFGIAVRCAAGVVALSRRVADTMAAGASASKVVVSAPGCDTTLFAGSTEESPVLNVHPVLADKPFILYAGALDSKLEPVMDIAAALAPMAPAPSMVICGDGPARGHLEAHARDGGILGRSVIFLGALPRQRTAPLFAKACAVIATGPSDHFYDGLAAGRPMIVLGNSAERELVESRGAGIGVPANDAGAAAREIADFTNDADGLRRAQQQAAALAAGRFNLERIAGEYRAVIEDAVTADPRSAVMRRRMLRTKRAIDVAVSLAGLVILSPLFLGIGVVIAAKMGWPIFFTQQRAGLKGRPFQIYKFRTMTGGPGTTDAKQFTPLGLFLRRTSLDDLPKLLNVLLGQMSLVGPRALLPEYIPYYSPEQRRRHDLRPGMTGWSQVTAGNDQGWPERFAHDVWYVDNVSLWLDFKIILKTFWMILIGKGAEAASRATMPRFDEIMAHSQGAEDA